MSNKSKDKIHKNQSPKQSKEKKPTLTDYAEQLMKEKGLLVKRVKLPKDWTRVIFKL